MDYKNLASPEIVQKIIKALAAHNIEAELVQNKEQALARIKELIPAGASIMNGSSVTLEQIGFIDYLKNGEHGWDNLHENILKEQDKVKQSRLRKEAVLADYYLGSLHAAAETGELVIASNTGSQLPHLAFTSPNIILIVSTKKITPDLPSAIKRLEEHVLPLENVLCRERFGRPSNISKILIFKHEFRRSGRKVRVIFVNEDLGF